MNIDGLDTTITANLEIVLFNVITIQLVGGMVQEVIRIVYGTHTQFNIVGARVRTLSMLTSIMEDGRIFLWTWVSRVITKLVVIHIGFQVTMLTLVCLVVWTPNGWSGPALSTHSPCTTSLCP